MVEINREARSTRYLTLELGIFEPNNFGLYDLHGNICEWCSDIWHDSYANSPTNGDSWLNNPDLLCCLVIRGGSWYDTPNNCRSAFRSPCEVVPEELGHSVGFRVVI